MSTAVQPHVGADQTDIPGIVRASVKLGILESIFVLAIGLGSIYLVLVVVASVAAIPLMFVTKAGQ